MRKIFSNQFLVMPVQFFQPFSRILEEDRLIYKEKGTSVFFREEGQSLSFLNVRTKRDSPQKKSLSPFK